MESKILFEDGELVVCLKPAGLLSETGGMPEVLQNDLGGTFSCVHRLDRAAGGVMVYARTKRTAAELSAQIAAGGMRKEYLAVVQGVPPEPKGSFCDLLFHDAARNKSFVVTRPRRGVREAKLDYELLGTAEREGEHLSALRITLLTGRSHQIRVQFASRSLPLVGDARYGSRIRGCDLALWSAALRFAHPSDGRELSFSAPPPADFPWTLFSLHNT